MGLNDSQTVALIGAHTVGFAHAQTSGFFGPWVTKPLRFSNEFFSIFSNGVGPQSVPSGFDYIWDANSLTPTGSITQFIASEFTPLTGSESNVCFSGAINSSSTTVRPVNTIPAPSCSSAGGCTYQRSASHARAGLDR